jgi:hypothetical protein
LYAIQNTLDCQFPAYTLWRSVLFQCQPSRAFAQDNDQIQTAPVVNEVVKVYGLTYVFYPFKVPSHALNTRLIGGYDVVGGAEPTIELRIIDRESCAFANGAMLGCTKYFEKEVKSFGVVEIRLGFISSYKLGDHS